MARPKKNSDTSGNEKPKKKRDVISLKVKQEIIDLKKNGKSCTEIARMFNYPYSTVATIYSKMANKLWRLPRRKKCLHKYHVSNFKIFCLVVAVGHTES